MVLFQSKVVFRLCINLISIVFILSGCKKENKETLPFYNTSEFTAEWIDSKNTRFDKIHQIDTFTLTNQLGQTITRDSLEGHIYVANFFFSICPSVCPKMMRNLLKLQKDFAKNPDIKLVSYSVMPWVDSVARLKKYGQENHINPVQWHLLTGGKDEIYNLARKSYFAEKDFDIQKNKNEFLHTETMTLIDKKLRIRGVYNATQIVDIERVAEDIKLLMREQ